MGNKRCFICDCVLSKNNSEIHHIYGKNNNDCVVDVCITCHNYIHLQRGEEYLIDLFAEITKDIDKLSKYYKLLFFKIIYLFSQVKGIKDDTNNIID